MSETIWNLPQVMKELVHQYSYKEILQALSEAEEHIDDCRH